MELELDEMVSKIQRKSLQSYSSFIIMAHNHQLSPLQPEAAEWLNGWTGYISLSSWVFGLDSKGKQETYPDIGGNAKRIHLCYLLFFVY